MPLVHLQIINQRVIEFYPTVIKSSIHKHLVPRHSRAVAAAWGDVEIVRHRFIDHPRSYVQECYGIEA